jgi:hypothetical protein
MDIYNILNISLYKQQLDNSKCVFDNEIHSVAPAFHKKKKNITNNVFVNTIHYGCTGISPIKTQKIMFLLLWIDLPNHVK